MTDLQRISKRLVDLGFFVAIQQESYIGLYRDVSQPLRQEIHLTNSNKFKWLGAELRISIRIPEFARSPKDEVEHYNAIEGMLTPEGVKYQGESQQPNWSYAQREQFVDTLLNKGLKWLDSLSDTNVLIAFLINGLEKGIPCSPTQISIRDRLLGRLFFRHEPIHLTPNEVRRPPIFKRALADIYIWLGDVEEAARYIQEWIEFNKTQPRNVKRYIEKFAEIASN